MATIECADPGVPWAALLQPPTLAPEYLIPLLDCLIAWNLSWLAFNRAPPLYASGVRYVEDGPGTERWSAIPHVLRKRSADCKSLAAWRAAELLRMGERGTKATFTCKETPQGRLYHVLVYRQDGRVEDPSRTLGMR